jgi:4-amino-4-deoxy-L-arabinose transferase-like glycosyltransferase
MISRKWQNMASIVLISAVSAWIYRLSTIFQDPISGDFPGYVKIAKNLTISPDTFAPYGVWPLGYPLMLKIASSFGDWQSAGSLISFISCLTVGLSAFFLLRIYFNPLSALVGALASILTKPVLVYSVGYSSDVPAVAFAFLSLLSLAKWTEKKSSYLLFLAGIFSGLSYLTRYSSISIVLCLITMIFFYPYFEVSKHSLKESFQSILVILGGWLLSSSPQLVGSWIVHGNPFYTENGCNVALSIGWRMQIPGLTWGNVEDVFPYCKSIGAILLEYPQKSAVNFALNLVSSAFELKIQLLSGIFVVYSTYFFDRERKDRGKQFVVATFFLVAACNVLLLSLAFVSDRHLMFSSSLLNCIIGATLISFATSTRSREISRRVFLIVLISYSAFVMGIFNAVRVSEGFYAKSARTDKVLKVVSTLSLLGCNDAGKSDTILIGDDFMDLEKNQEIGLQVWRQNYRPFVDIGNARSWMDKHGYKCMIFDKQSLERIPNIDASSYRKEYQNGLLFPLRKKIDSHDTYIFKLD